jgi:hypothetical protein
MTSTHVRAHTRSNNTNDPTLRRAEGKALAEEFENMRDVAELNALSKHSLTHPLTDKQYARMMQLAKKLGIQPGQVPNIHTGNWKSRTYREGITD